MESGLEVLPPVASPTEACAWGAIWLLKSLFENRAPSVNADVYDENSKNNVEELQADILTG